MNWNWKAEIRGDYDPWNYVQLHARPKSELLKPQRGVCNWPRLNTTQMHSNQCREEVTEHLLSRTETCNEIMQLLSSPAVCSSSVSRRLVIVASDSCSTTRKAIHSSKRQRGKSPPLLQKGRQLSTTAPYFKPTPRCAASCVTWVSRKYTKFKGIDVERPLGHLKKQGNLRAAWLHTWPLNGCLQQPRRVHKMIFNPVNQSGSHICENREQFSWPSLTQKEEQSVAPKHKGIALHANSRRQLCLLWSLSSWPSFIY